MKRGEFAVEAAPSGTQPDLTGLSCRFEEIPAVRGLILSVLVVPARKAEAPRKPEPKVAVVASAPKGSGPVAQIGATPSDADARRLLSERPDIALRFVRGYCRGVYRFRTDARFGLDVLRKYTGETDEGVLAGTWLMFARLMGGMMFPSLEGVRAALDLLRRLGAVGGDVTAEQQLSVEPVAALEREDYFATFMGRGGAGQGRS